MFRCRGGLFGTEATLDVARASLASRSSKLRTLLNLVSVQTGSNESSRPTKASALDSELATAEHRLSLSTTDDFGGSTTLQHRPRSSDRFECLGRLASCGLSGCRDVRRRLVVDASRSSLSAESALCRSALETISHHLQAESSGSIQLQWLNRNDSQFRRCEAAALGNVRPGFFVQPARSLAVAGVFRLHHPTMLSKFQSISRDLPAGAVRGVFVHPHPGILPALLVRGFACCCGYQENKYGVEPSDTGSGGPLLGVARTVFKARAAAEARRVQAIETSEGSSAAEAPPDEESIHAAARRLGAIESRVAGALSRGGRTLGVSAGHLSGWGEEAVEEALAAARALQCDAGTPRWVRASRYSTPEAERGLQYGRGEEAACGAKQPGPEKAWPPEGAIRWAHPGMHRDGERRAAAIDALGGRASLLRTAAQGPAPAGVFSGTDPMPPLLAAVQPISSSASNASGEGGGAAREGGSKGPTWLPDGVRVAVLCRSVIPSVVHAGPGQEWKQRLEGAGEKAARCPDFRPEEIEGIARQARKAAEQHGVEASASVAPVGYSTGRGEFAYFHPQQLLPEFVILYRTLDETEAPAGVPKGPATEPRLMPNRSLPLHRDPTVHVGPPVDPPKGRRPEVASTGSESPQGMIQGAPGRPLDAAAEKCGELSWRDAGEVSLPPSQLDLPSEELQAMLEPAGDESARRGTSSVERLDVAASAALREVAAALASLPVPAAVAKSESDSPAGGEADRPSRASKRRPPAPVGAAVSAACSSRTGGAKEVAASAIAAAASLGASAGVPAPTPASAQVHARALLRALGQAARHSGAGPSHLRDGQVDSRHDVLDAEDGVASVLRRVQAGVSHAEATLNAALDEALCAGTDVHDSSRETVGAVRASMEAVGVVEGIAAASLARQRRAAAASVGVLEALRVLSAEGDLSADSAGSAAAIEVMSACRQLPAAALLGGEAWHVAVMRLCSSTTGLTRVLRGDGGWDSDWTGKEELEASKGEAVLPLGLVRGKGVARPGHLRREQCMLLQQRAVTAGLRMRVAAQGGQVGARSTRQASAAARREADQGAEAPTPLVRASPGHSPGAPSGAPHQGRPEPKSLSRIRGSAGPGAIPGGQHPPVSPMALDADGSIHPSVALEGSLSIDGAGEGKEGGEVGEGGDAGGSKSGRTASRGRGGIAGNGKARPGGEAASPRSPRAARHLIDAAPARSGSGSRVVRRGGSVGLGLGRRANQAAIVGGTLATGGGLARRGSRRTGR